jgi:DNA-binding response OmpR family regulator
MKWQREQPVPEPQPQPVADNSSEATAPQDSNSVTPFASVASHIPLHVLPPIAAPAPHDVFTFDGRTLDFNTLELTAPLGKIQLTLMEASLLRYFIEHRNENVSRKQILEEVWGLHEDTDTRAIDNFIVRLRRYIEDSPGTPRYLITVRGIGYRFLPE